MSFTTALAKIHKNLIYTFEKAADAAVKGETDAEQTFRDFEKACKDTGITSTDAIRDELKKHLTKSWMDSGMSKVDAEAQFGAKWKNVKDLGDKVIKYAPKVETAAKVGWLKFVGVVTAIFSGAMIYVYTQTPSGPTPDQKAALDIIRHVENTRRQIGYLNQIVISQNELYELLRGLEVQSAPTLVLPIPIAVAATAPVEVQVTTPNGTRTFETTFGQVYVNSPPPVREHLVNNPPETYGNDDPGSTENSGHSQGGVNDHHKTFTVGGTPFGSATFSY